MGKARFRQWASGAAIVASIGGAGSALAQTRRFDVPAQSASSGIPMFAHQAGIQILVGAPAVERLRTNRVQGTMEVDTALRTLLAGTDLVPARVGNAVVLRRREPVSITSTTASFAPLQDGSAPAGGAGFVPDEPPAEDIVVTGIRQSVQESINVKRSAASIVDVISAQDIGKLPDQNVAESLSRVTGVQIGRREGDGSTFTVRGISQNRLEINGRTFIGPSNGGGAALEAISPEILSSIVVTKSPTADMPEGALGATVNLRTKRPLALKDFVAAGRIQGAYADQANHVGYRTSGLISKNFGDRFGVLASVAYQDTKTLGYSFESGGWTRTNAIDGNGDGIDDANLFRPNRLMARIYDRAEQRLTVNGTMQFKPTDNLELILDGTFNHLKRQRNSVNYQILLNNNDVGAVANQNGTVVAGTFRGVTLRPLIYDEPTDLKSTTLGMSGKWEEGRGQVTFDLSYSKGEGSDGFPGASFTYVIVPRAGRTVDASYDFRPGNAFPNLSLTSNFNRDDPTNYQLLSVFDADTNTSNVGYEGRVDWTYRTDWGPLSSVQAGFRYEKVDLFTADPQNLPVAAALLGRGDRNGDGIITIDELGGVTYDQRYGTFYPGVPGEFPRNLLGGSIDKNAARASLGLVRPTPFGSGITVGPTSVKDVTQDTLGFYGKVNGETEFGGVVVTGNAGLRYITTLRESTGYLSATQRNPSKAEFNYLLPSANMAVNLTNDLTLRLAAAKVVARPSLGEVSTSFVPNTVAFTGSRGNPSLRPFEATQYDATLEWYFAPASSITGAIFRKNVNSFTVVTVTREFVPGFSERFGLFDISQPTNGANGTIQGFELAYQHALRFLPGILRNLGVQANYTFVDSSTPLVDSITGARLPLPGLSRDSYTLIGYYEDKGVSLRAAYTYRSAFLSTVQSAASGGNAYSIGRGQLDASAQINLTRNVRLTVDAINLTKEIAGQYLQTPERLSLTTREDRRIFLGIAAAF